MEGYSSKGKHTLAKKIYNKSESLCEDALEILQEILHYYSSLRVWSDRDISFEVDVIEQLSEKYLVTKSPILVFEHHEHRYYKNKGLKYIRELLTNKGYMVRKIYGK